MKYKLNHLNLCFLPIWPLVLLFHCILYSVSTAQNCSILFSVPLLCLKVQIKFMPKNTMEHIIWTILSDSFNMTHIIWAILYEKVRMYVWTCWLEDIMTSEMRNNVFFEWTIRRHYQLIITSNKSFNPYWTKRYWYSDCHFASFHNFKSVS